MGDVRTVRFEVERCFASQDAVCEGQGRYFTQLCRLKLAPKIPAGMAKVDRNCRKSADVNSVSVVVDTDVLKLSKVH